MDFIDNIDFVSCAHWPVAHALNQFPYIIDASTAGGIHFNYIDMAILGDGDAMFTISTRFNRGSAFTIIPDTIKRSGNNSRGTGFSNPANTR